jgi:hypothetical protein
VKTPASAGRSTRRDVWWFGMMAFASTWASLCSYGYPTGFIS